MGELMGQGEVFLHRQTLDEVRSLEHDAQF